VGMDVCCDRCVLWGRVLCDELITRLEESYRLWWVVVCDLETSWMRRPWPTGGLLRKKKNIYIYLLIIEWCHIHIFYHLWLTSCITRCMGPEVVAVAPRRWPRFVAKASRRIWVTYSTVSWK
jgi:hypothetical protein